MPNFLTLQTLDTNTIISLVKRALEFKRENKSLNLFSDKTIANLFFENSTRTKTSFIMAQKKLGMNELPFDISTSSVNKGENLYDTVRALEEIGVDAVVIRHGQDLFFDELKNVKIPIINAGDGKSNHPSQAILDLVTIYEAFGRFEGLNICIAGDIAHSRVAHSNAEIMKRLGMNVQFVAPEIFQESAMSFKKLDDIIESLDILMLLRIQNERHTTHFNIDNYLTKYGLSVERYAKLKDSAIIMHPGPVNRNVEIDDSLLEADKSRIFTQIKNGVFSRMAILEYAFSK